MPAPSHIKLTTIRSDNTPPANALLDGLLDYYPHAIPATDASHLYQQLLQDIPWQTAHIHIHGRTQQIPRLQS